MTMPASVTTYPVSAAFRVVATSPRPDESTSSGPSPAISHARLYSDFQNLSLEYMRDGFVRPPATARVRAKPVPCQT